MRAHGMNAILLGSLGWWDKLDRSKTWQDGIFDALSALYAIISIVALIQLIRIKLRLPEYGWTTQKVFHLLNFLVNGVRAAVFFFRRHIQSIKPRIFRSVLLDAPGLLFFSTYTLLVLFWAEIYFQARSIRTDGLRPSFLITNAVVYVIQFCIWIFFWWSPNPAVEIFSKIFFAGVSFIAAIGFLVYGGRLFLMLRRFPVDSKGRQKKLQEVGWVTAICFTCFLIRCLMVILSAFIKEADINNLQKPIITAVYYLLVEIVPSALVLYILRKLPPTRTSGQFQSVR